MLEGERIEPVMLWILLGIALFGLIVGGAAFVLTLAQLIAVLFGLWP